MEVRNLLTRFGADTSGFTKGAAEVKGKLTDLNKSFYENQKAMKEVNNELKLLEKEQKKLDELVKKGEISKQSKEYEENAKKLDALNLKKAQLKTNEQALKTEINATTAELKEQSEAAKVNKISMEDVASGLKKIAVGYAGVVTAAFAFTAKMAANADDLNTLSKQTGLTTDELQKFQYASDIIDVSMETLTGSMSRMIRNMYNAQQGTGTAKEAFEALGVEIERNGQLIDKNIVFENTIKALEKVGNETERDALAMQIFGRSAQELNPLILGGADALRQLGDEAERNGLILSQEQLDKLNAFNDKIDTFKANLKQLAMSAGTEMVDAFDGLWESADDVVEIVKDLAVATSKVIGFTVEHKDVILAAAVAYGTFKASMSIGSLIASLASAIGTLTTANGRATASQLALNTAMKANPLVLVASLALSAATAIGTLVFANKDAKEATYIATEALESEVEAVNKLKDRYTELSEKTDLTGYDKAELQDIQEQLISLYGDEAAAIDLVNGKYDEQIEKLKSLSAQKLSELENQQIVNYNTAKSEFTDNKSSSLFGQFDVTTGEADILSGVNGFVGAYTQAGANFKLNGDAAERYDAVSEALDKLKATGITTGDVYDELVNLQTHYSAETEKLEEELTKLINTTQARIEAGTNEIGIEERLAEYKAEYVRLTGKSIEVKNKEIQASQNVTEAKKQEYLTEQELNSALENNVALAENIEAQKTLKLAAETANRIGYYQREILAIQSVADANAILAQMEKDRMSSSLGINSASDAKEHQETYGSNFDLLQEQLKSLSADMFSGTSSGGGSSSASVDANFSKALGDAKYKLDMDVIDEKQYFATMEQLLKDYHADGKEEYRQYYVQLHNFKKNANATETSLEESGLSELNDIREKAHKQQLENLEKQKNEKIKIINDELEAEKNLLDTKLSAIDKEIEARKRLTEDRNLDKEIEAVQAKLKYSQLDDFSRMELERQLSGLQTEKSEIQWQRDKADEKEQLQLEYEEYEKSAKAQIEAVTLHYETTIDKLNSAFEMMEMTADTASELIEQGQNRFIETYSQLQNSLAYVNSMFQSLQAAQLSSGSVTTYSSSVQNNFNNQNLSAEQIARIVYGMAWEG